MFENFSDATSVARRIPGPNLRFDCPACGRKNTLALTYDFEERIRLYGVPIPTQRERYVACSVCGETQLSAIPLADLAALAPDEIRQHLYRRVSIIVKLFPVLSVLLFCFPGVGLILGIVGLVTTRRSRGWPFRLSLIGVVLTVVLWGGLLARSALAEL